MSVLDTSPEDNDGNNAKPIFNNIEYGDLTLEELAALSFISSSLDLFEKNGGARVVNDFIGKAYTKFNSVNQPPVDFIFGLNSVLKTLSHSESSLLRGSYSVDRNEVLLNITNGLEIFGLFSKQGTFILGFSDIEGYSRIEMFFSKMEKSDSLGTLGVIVAFSSLDGLVALQTGRIPSLGFVFNDTSCTLSIFLDYSGKIETTVDSMGAMGVGVYNN